MSAEFESLPRRRRDAIAIGENRFFTGKACPKGHVAPHYVSGGCSFCQKLRARVHRQGYKRAWRERDPRAAWVRNAIDRARERSKQKGVPYALTPDYVRSLIVDECPILGVPLLYRAEGGSIQPNTATIDRVKPWLGYIPGNVMVMSMLANRAKSNFSLEQLKQLVLIMENHEDAVGQKLAA